MVKKLIRITNTGKALRRAGIEHPKGVSNYPAERFSTAQLDALKAEPRLIVELVEVPAVGAGGEADGKAAGSDAKTDAGKGGRK